MTTEAETKPTVEQTEDSPKVEDVTEEENQQQQQQEEQGENAPSFNPEELLANLPQMQQQMRPQQSRGEKKSRKALQKLGMKPIEGVSRVTMKQGQMLIVVSQPEVFKSSSGETYVVFGQANVENLNSNKSNELLNKLGEAPPSGEGAAAENPAAQVEEVEEEGEVDETGLEDNDIELVMNQASVSRAKAVKALHNTNKDVVNAIMELTGA